ncbi:MAG: SRPBCC family protein [Actinoallomurus sp.]
MNATLHTADGRSVLRFERRLGHPVPKVWRAVTDAAEMAHWFPASVEMDLRAGGKIQFAFPGGEMDSGDGVITELDPPRVFAFTWNGDPLRLELRPDGEGTLLIFTHTFDDRPMAGSFATGWETCLGALEKTLDVPAGQAPDGPGAPAAYAERHDAYLAAFGLGEGTVGEDAQGFTVRFERLLPHPVEQVWPELLGAATPTVGGEPPLRVTNGHVTAGALTEVIEHRVLEYEWLSGGAPAGRVRWELTGGHPAGTRLVLTQRGPARPAAERVGALAAWHTQLELFADHLRGATRCWPEDRTEELRGHYAGLVEAR